MDCIAHEALYWSNNIKGYPTLLAFIAGEPIPYEGPRETDSIVSFMRELSVPLLVPLRGEKQVALFSRQYRSATKPVVLVLVKGEDGAAEGAGEREESAEVALDLVCRKLDSFACGVVHVSDEEGGGVARGFGVKTLPAFVLLPVLSEEGEEGEESAVVLEASADTTETMSVSALRHWVLLHAYPPVVSFSEAHMDLMFSPKRPGFENHVLLFVDKSASIVNLGTSSGGGGDGGGVTRLLAEFEELAKEFSGKCIFITVDVSRTERDNEFTQNLLSDLSITMPGAEEGEGDGEGGEMESSESAGETSPSPRVIIIKSARTRIEFYHLLGAGGGVEQAEVTGERIKYFVQQFFDRDVQPSRIIEVPI